MWTVRCSSFTTSWASRWISHLASFADTNLAEEIDGAIKGYCADVRSGDFPNDEESYTS